MRFFNLTHRRTVIGSSILLGTSILLLVQWRLYAAEPKSLIQIEAKDKDSTDFTMKATELERGDKTSTIKLIRKKRLGSVGSSMFVVRAFYEIAKARKCEYFANLKEWDDKDGSHMFIAGFTNKKDADIKKEFGDQFSYNNEFGQERKLLSVSQFSPAFEKTSAFPVTVETIAAPSTDSKTLQPGSSSSK